MRPKMTPNRMGAADRSDKPRLARAFGNTQNYRLPAL
jgi:hypothetical protein